MEARPGVMNIGATVVTSSREMIRGLVRVTRSASRDGAGRTGSAAGSPTWAGVRPEWKVRITNPAQIRAPTSRCAALSAGGRSPSTMAAAIPTCSTVTATRTATERRISRLAGSDRRLRRTARARTAARNPKASARWAQGRKARWLPGGSSCPLQSGKPRQSRPVWKLATWAPNRITAKPRTAVAST